MMKNTQYSANIRHNRHFQSSRSAYGNASVDGDPSPIFPPMYDVVFKLTLFGDERDVKDIEILPVLENFLGINKDKALSLCKDILNQGCAHYMTCTREVAETKMRELNELFRRHSFPLFCSFIKSDAHDF